MSLFQLAGELDLDSLQGIALNGDPVVGVLELLNTGLLLALRYPHLIVLILELIDLELQCVTLMLVVFLQLVHSGSQGVNLIRLLGHAHQLLLEILIPQT